MTAANVIHLEMGLTLQTSGRIIDVLTAAGYAVVKLPEWPHVGWPVMQQANSIEGARIHAANLLAAADAAEATNA